MSKPNYGWAFHCHHDTLIEWCSDYAGRVRYIKEQKPEHERPLRLKLFKLISPKKIESSLGQKAYAEWDKADAKWLKADAEREKADAEFVKTYAERDKAYAKWLKAYAEWDKAYAEWQKADAKWLKAYAEREKAYAKWLKATAERLEALQKNLPAILLLHKRLCSCKWKSQTLTGNIFEYEKS